MTTISTPWHLRELCGRIGREAAGEKDYGRRVFEADTAKGAIGREAAAGIYLEYTVLPSQKTRAMALESAE